MHRRAAGRRFSESAACPSRHEGRDTATPYARNRRPAAKASTVVYGDGKYDDKLWDMDAKKDVWGGDVCIAAAGYERRRSCAVPRRAGTFTKGRLFASCD